MKGILSWGSKEGTFLLNGAIIGHLKICLKILIIIFVVELPKMVLCLLLCKKLNI